MSGNEIVELSQEEMDCVLYDAREGDLQNLKEIFNEISPKLLLEIKDEFTLSTAFHMASANGNLEVLDYLLSILSPEDATKAANMQNETGNTALHWGAYNGHLDVVALLVDKYNADVFIKNESGHDAMFEAENNGHDEVEQWFLKKFAVEDDINIEEGENDTKITYTPGKETKEADERARKAQEMVKDIEKNTGDLEIQ